MKERTNETGSLQGIFQSSFEAYAAKRKLPLKHYKAAHAIMTCRTPEQGGHIQACPDGHESHIQYHSCRHRSCPRCNALPKEQWIHKQLSKLLEVDHYHLIFTLPHELIPVWKYNKRWFAHTLFHVVKETLLTLSKEDKYMGALPGLLLSLHTWGRNLSLHPHVHCLMTGGGLTDTGEWKGVRNNYLLPARVVRALYQGEFLAALWKGLKKEELSFPSDMQEQSFTAELKKLGKKKWNVRIQPPYTHGRGVVKYLSRYVKGGPIGDHRLISSDEKMICFSYKDHNDGMKKIQTLSTTEFINRVLEHVAEPYQHTIRYGGLYGLQARNKRNLCREQLGTNPEKDVEPLTWIDYLEQQGDPIKVACLHCGKPLVQGGTVPKISINRVWGSGYVQQSVEPAAIKCSSISGFRALNDYGGDFDFSEVHVN